MAEDMWQQIESILREDSYSLYKEACLKEDWRQAHELLRDCTLERLKLAAATVSAATENCKRQEQLIKKYEETIERYEETIERDEKIIEKIIEVAMRTERQS